MSRRLLRGEQKVGFKIDKEDDEDDDHDESEEDEEDEEDEEHEEDEGGDGEDEDDDEEEGKDVGETKAGAVAVASSFSWGRPSANQAQQTCHP